jgi:uncharacterized low-complexity protein
MMKHNKTLNPIAIAMSTTFAVSLAASPVVNAAPNPFNMTDLGNGYMIAEEGSCGDKKMEEGKCGDKKMEEGKCGDKKMEEGKCGDKKMEEGKCGDKKMEEGKCGEGKCGDKKKS